jgi:hypothetical protein
MALITAVNINNTRLKTGATNLPVRVIGDSDAIFSVQVTRSSDSRFYDFTTRIFEAATTSQSRLKNQSPGTFSLAIPAAASGDTYTIIIMAEPHYDTRLSIGNGIRYATTVTQKGNATITFAALGTGLLTSTAIGNSTGSITNRFKNSGRPTVVMRDLQINVTEAVEDYGFFITTTNNDKDKNNGTWDSGALYWQTGNYVAQDNGTASTTLLLDSVDGLYVGMQVSYVNTVYQSDLRAITAINTDTKTVTLDGAETWSKNHVILFRAYGPELIQDAIGIGLKLTNPTVRLAQLTTSIDNELTSNVSSTTPFNVNGTLGIGKGATVRMRGLEKSLDAGAATVVTVDSGANGGGITGGAIAVQYARIKAGSERPVRTKTKIYIDGCSNKIYLSGTISINKYPEDDQNIYVDTNKILTTGIAS